MTSHRVWLSVWLIFCLPLQGMAVPLLPCVHNPQTMQMQNIMPCHQSTTEHTDTEVTNTCDNCSTCHLSTPYSPVLTTPLQSVQHKPEQNPAKAHYFYQHIAPLLLKPPQVL